MEESAPVIVSTSNAIELAVITADEIVALHKEAVSLTWNLMDAGTKFLQKAAQIGKLLIAKKAEVGHGNWLPWLAENIKEFGIDTAQDYMKAARYSDRGLNMSVTSLRQIRDLREAVGLLEDKPETDPKEREKPAFVIRCTFNVDPNQLDELQRRTAFDQAKPMLDVFQAFGFIEIKA